MPWGDGGVPCMEGLHYSALEYRGYHLLLVYGGLRPTMLQNKTIYRRELMALLLDTIAFGNIATLQYIFGLVQIEVDLFFSLSLLVFCFPC